MPKYHSPTCRCPCCRNKRGDYPIHKPDCTCPVCRRSRGEYVEPWNKGLSAKDDPRVAQMWKTRKENDPTDEWSRRGEETKRKNDPDGLRFQKQQETARRNDPEGKRFQKTWKTRKEKYGPSGNINPELVSDKHRQIMINGGSEKLRRIIEQNDPTGERYVKAWKTRRERYGYVGCKNPEQWKNTLSKFWKQQYQNLSPEEKAEFLRRTVFQGNLRPNVSERILSNYLEPLSFRYNGRGPVIINGHFPDFVHKSLPLVIEYDGIGGHDPLVPWVPENKLELDNQRDDDYRKAGYYVLRVFPEDLEKGKELVQNKVKKWMLQGHRVVVT